MREMIKNYAGTLIQPETVEIVPGRPFTPPPYLLIVGPGAANVMDGSKVDVTEADGSITTYVVDTVTGKKPTPDGFECRARIRTETFEDRERQRRASDYHHREY